MEASPMCSLLQFLLRWRPANLIQHRLPQHGSAGPSSPLGSACQIKEEAFAAAAADSSAPASADAAAADDDLEIGTLQMYSREISKRMLSAVKARASSASSFPPSTPPIETPLPASAASPTSGDEAPTVESETSQA